MVKKKADTQKANSSPLADIIKAVLSHSIGRLPMSLVVLLLLALMASLLSGFFMHFFAQKKPTNDFLPLRLEISEDVEAVDAKVLQGNWIVQTDAYAMSLFIEGDKFEWIVRTKDTGDTQFFARGNFRIEGDVMILAQRPDMGQPADPTRPWVVNMPMAMKNLNLRYALPAKKQLTWEIPSSEQEKIFSHTGAIFIGNDQGKFSWVKR